LLVDMDLRRGRLHKSLGVEKTPGMTDVLSEGKPFQDVIQTTRFEKLWFAPAGSTIDNSAETLQSVDLKRIFGEIKDDYDYILIDTSPVLRVTDTVIVANQHLGVVVYVARVGRTPKPMIRYSLDLLKDVRVIGMIMNSIEMHKISSLYYAYQYPNYAYYSNAYAYGYDYYYDDSGKGAGKGGPHRGPIARKRQALFKWLRGLLLPTE
jgi:tyrosine-protein kinase Etk/Wzc